jgi:Zn-dependent metalloprotease
MNAHPSCFCSFIPPHVYDHLSKSGDPAQREAARRSMELTARLRGQRDVLGLLPSLSVTPGVMRRTIYDAQEQQQLPGTVVRGEDGAVSGDVAVNQAFDGAGVVWNFYKTLFNRDSLDNRGMRLDSTVHYGSGYNNAFWNGSQMIYGDGDGQILHNFVAALDVIGHEMTHGVTENASALVYQGESGALNEHLSDVFGILVKQWNLKQSAANADWLIGAGILIPPDPLPPGAVARALRDMLNPGTAYAGLSIGDDPQPATYANLFTGPFDNGGVHINSGIPNKAFATYAVALGGNAWETPGSVWFQTATAMGLSATATFADFRALTLKAAQQTAPTTVDALTAAWKGVGL